MSFLVDIIFISRLYLVVEQIIAPEDISSTPRCVTVVLHGKMGLCGCD